MAAVEFYDEEDNSITPLNENTELPDEVVSMTIWAEFGGDYECDSISDMLQEFPKKLQKVVVHDIYRFAPDYLALFEVILHKTERLVLSDSLRHNVEICQAFQHHSIQALHLFQLGRLSTIQARHIFDAIAYSSSLRKLHLDVIFEEHHEAIPLLVDALRQNRSLMKLSLSMQTVEGDRFFSDAIRAAVLDMKIEHLSIADPHRLVQLPMEDLVEAVCRPDCQLESLHLLGIEPTATHPTDIMEEDCFLLRRNPSVKNLHISEITLDCSRIMDTVSLFQSLVSLNLVDTNISDLSPLDSLLIGGDDHNLTLQRLSMSGSQSSDQDILDFILKIPEMMSLRNLNMYLDAPGVQIDSWKQAFGYAIARNKSLEQLNLGTRIQFDNSLLPLHINRAWKNISKKHLQPNLWPLVLEKATKLLYFRDSDEWEKPSLESPRVDVLFWLLKEVVVPQSYC